jgi:hypothetical protein
MLVAEPPAAEVAAAPPKPVTGTAEDVAVAAAAEEADSMELTVALPL